MRTSEVTVLKECDDSDRGMRRAAVAEENTLE